MIEKIEGLVLSNVEVISSQILNNSYYKVLFHFEDTILEIAVDNSTDELMLTTKESKSTIIEKDLSVPKWSSRIIGKKVISYWLSKNSRGYSDCICIGFDEFIPSIVITSIVSHLEVRFALIPNDKNANI